MCDFNVNWPRLHYQLQTPFVGHRGPVIKRIGISVIQGCVFMFFFFLRVLFDLQFFFWLSSELL